MTTFLLTVAVLTVTLGLVSLIAGRRPNRSEDSTALQLLPGDIKYESPDGRFRLYLPVTTSIVVSIVLTLVLRLFA